MHSLVMRRALVALLLLFGVIAAGRAQFNGCVGGLCSGPAQIRNIVLNGDFAGGTTSWSGFGFSGKAVTGAKAVMTANPTFDGYNQNAVFVIGKYYEVTFTISSYSAGTYYPFFNGGSAVSGTGRSANGTFTERLLTLTGNNNFGMQASAGPATLVVDDISVTGPYNTP